MKTKKTCTTKDRLLDVAQAQFSTIGYQGATVEGITKAVGIRPSALYKHYGSKWELFGVVVERLATPVLEALRADVRAGLPLTAPHIPPDLLRIMLLCAMAGGSEAQLLADKMLKPLRWLHISNGAMTALYRQAGDAALSLLCANNGIDWGQDA